jgi:hypothetical protein
VAPMPVLITNTTAATTTTANTTNNIEQAEEQEPIASSQRNSDAVVRKRHRCFPIETRLHLFQVDLLTSLDEPVQMSSAPHMSNNDNLFELLTKTDTSFDPLEDLLFGTPAPSTSKSIDTITSARLRNESLIWKEFSRYFRHSTNHRDR